MSTVPPFSDPRFGSSGPTLQSLLEVILEGNNTDSASRYCAEAMRAFLNHPSCPQLQRLGLEVLILAGEEHRAMRYILRDLFLCPQPFTWLLLGLSLRECEPQDAVIAFILALHSKDREVSSIAEDILSDLLPIAYPNADCDIWCEEFRVVSLSRADDLLHDWKGFAQAAVETV